MSQHIQSNSNGTVTIERDGTPFTGISTGIPTNSPTLRKLAGQKRTPATIVRNGSLEQWQLRGFVEHEGTIYVFGPEIDATPLDQVLEDTGRNRLEALSFVASAYATLLDQEIKPGIVHTRSVFLLRDGVLFMPPDIMQAIREHQNYAERIRTMERFQHPDRSAIDNIGFFLAASAYYIMTGEFAYDGADEEELHARVRTGATVPPQARNIAIETETSEVLFAALTSEKPVASPREWALKLARWGTDGFTEQDDAAETARRKKTAEEAHQRMEKGFRRKEGLRRNGRTALIVAIVAIIVGTIPFTILRNALAPRETAGFSPQEVVSAFYGAFNSLDHMLMEDAVIDDAGRPYIREVTNLFVLDRQRVGVEGRSGFVDAAAWRENGMPSLEPTVSPYGVYNLSLTELEAPSDERWFEASYERWLPDFESAETGGSRIAGLQQTEEVRMRQDGDDWVIYDFELLDSDPIDVNELRDEIRESED